MELQNGANKPPRLELYKKIILINYTSLKHNNNNNNSMRLVFNYAL